MGNTTGLRKSDVEADGKVCLSLLDEERSTFAQQMASVSTVTFFNGKAPEKYLRERVAKIVAKNPWLAGSFAKVDGCTQLVYPRSTAENKASQQLFQVLEVKLSRSTPLMEMRAVARDAIIRKTSAMNEGDAVFKVSLIRDHDQPERSFAVVVSLSHNVGDGHTFYTLYKMLCRKREVFALNPIRKPEVVNGIEDRLGAAESGWMKSIVFIGAMVMSLTSRAIFGMRSEVAIYDLNEAWIASEKKRYAETNEAKEYGVTYVSTNDVVTSWVLRKRRQGLGWMAVNFRNRLPSCTDMDAGNYTNVIMYREQDYSSPVLIRKSLETFRRAAKPATALPSPWETLRSLRMHAMTNWSTFYGDIDIGECEQTLHLPLVDFSDCFEHIEFGVIFRASKTKLALMMFGPTGFKRHLENEEAPGILGPELDRSS
ncbi:hypothetical protein AAMO2058_000518600 [Amorphochlora amoebiformis]